VLLNACKLAKRKPPDRDLGSASFDGPTLIREMVEVYSRRKEAQEEALRQADVDAKLRRERHMLELQQRYEASRKLTASFKRETTPQTKERRPAHA
jgi:hypothetical protein